MLPENVGQFQSFLSGYTTELSRKGYSKTNQKYIWWQRKLNTTEAGRLFLSQCKKDPLPQGRWIEINKISPKMKNCFSSFFPKKPTGKFSNPNQKKMLHWNLLHWNQELFNFVSPAKFRSKKLRTQTNWHSVYSKACAKFDRFGGLYTEESDVWKKMQSKHTKNSTVKLQWWKTYPRGLGPQS